MRDLYYILAINLLFILLVYKYFSYLRALFSKLRPPFYRVLLGIARKLQQAAAYLVKTAGMRISPNYRNLTAYAKADPEDPYIKLLKDCVQDPDTKNIALTGPYGSGKSSILRSFELSHPEYHCLNISLANFKEQTVSPVITALSDEGGIETKASEPLRIASIEYSILQQLFYHVRHQQIPFSRFKRIKNLSVYVLAVRAICLVFWLATICYFIWHEKILTSAAGWEVYLKWPPNILKLAFAVFVITGAIYLCYVLLRLYNNSKFHKFNLTSGEVEIAPASDASILNRHLDELLYFFEATNYNILIIEDLDRFDDPEIFVRLRELNNLLNYSRQVDRKISFIYALKDDVFRDEQRTKFFDYIIPVIPVIDHRNAAEKFAERLTELNIDRQSIPQSFILDVAAYVSDMRLLLNTINEFQLYQGKLGITPGSYGQLLSMIIFKNKYPKIFAQLHARKGLAYKVLSGRENFVKMLSTELLAEKDALEGKVKIVSDIYLRDTKELRMAYIGRVLESLTDFGGSFYIDTDAIDIKALTENDSHFERFTKSNNIRYMRTNSASQVTGTSFAVLEKMVDPDRTYKQRADEMVLRQQYRNDELQLLLQKVQIRLDELRGYRLVDIFALKPLHELNPILGKNALFNYFVTNGYLNEDYYYYLSYLYPGSLSRRDYDFFFAIKENKTLPSQAPLDQTSELIDRLAIGDFGRPGILNITLVDELLTIDSKGDKCAKLMTMVAGDIRVSSTFINDYFRLGKQRDKFMALLAHWDGLWVWIESDDNLTGEVRRDYLGLLLKNASLEDLATINQQERLVETIEQMPDFLTWSQGYLTAPRTKEILDKLNIDFFVLDAESIKEPLFDYVLDKFHYRFNPMMIELIVNAKGAIDAPGVDLRTKNLSTIMAANIPSLLQYVHEYPGYYIDNVFLELNENTKETEEVLLYLLNEDELGIDRHRQVLEKSVNLLSDITKVPGVLWSDILRLSRMEATWTNIYQVYAIDKKLTPELVTFINEVKNYENIAESGLDEIAEIDKVLLQTFGLAVMLSTAISLEAHEYLIPMLGYYYSDPDMTALNRDQVALIIEHDRLVFTPEVLQFIQTKHQGLQLTYFENNLETFFEWVGSPGLEDPSLGLLDYRLLLGSAKLSEEQHEILIEQMDFLELTRDEQLTRNLAALLEKPGFMPDLNQSALLTVFTQLRDNDSKKRLLLKYLPSLTEAETGELLAQMDEDYDELPRYNRPKFEINPLNTRLLKTLESKKYFINTLPDKKGKHVAYTKQRPTTHNL